MATILLIIGLVISAAGCFYGTHFYRKKYKKSREEKDSNLAMGFFLLGLACLIEPGLNFYKLIY
jgi:H+/Cl- antiporter ClcA